MKDETTGEDLVSIGFVVELEYADATTSAHDLLQTFKTHPLVREILEGGERVAWGAKALPGGGYWSMPKLSMPGAVLVGDSGGMVDTMALKGVHHCIKSGMLAAETIYEALKHGNQRSVELRAGDRGLFGRQGAVGGAQRAPAVPEGPAHRRPAQRRAIMSARASCPDGAEWHRNDEKPMFVGDTKDGYPKPDGKYTFDKLSSVFITRQRDARRRAQSHPRAETRAARDRRDVAVDVPGGRL